MFEKQFLGKAGNTLEHDPRPSRAEVAWHTSVDSTLSWGKQAWLAAWPIRGLLVHQSELPPSHSSFVLRVGLMFMLTYTFLHWRAKLNWLSKVAWTTLLAEENNLGSAQLTARSDPQAVSPSKWASTEPWRAQGWLERFIWLKYYIYRNDKKTFHLGLNAAKNTHRSQKTSK